MFENQISGHMVITVDSVKSGNGGFVSLKLSELRGVEGNKIFGTPDFTLMFGSLKGIGVSGKGVAFEVVPVFILNNVIDAPRDKNQRGVVPEVRSEFVEHFTSLIFVGGIIIDHIDLENNDNVISFHVSSR